MYHLSMPVAAVRMYACLTRRERQRPCTVKEGTQQHTPKNTHKSLETVASLHHRQITPAFRDATFGVRCRVESEEELQNSKRKGTCGSYDIVVRYHNCHSNHALKPHNLGPAAV